MQPKMKNSKSPPKFAIANGFVIGSSPQEVKWRTSNSDTKKRIIKEYALTDILKAMMAPVRPYGSIPATATSSQRAHRDLPESS
jgi:hypothetical protein